MVTRTLQLVFAAIAVGTTSPAVARAHPLHTTYSELSIYAGGRSARALIRVFADDFSATVVKNYPVALRSDRDFERAAYTYAVTHFRITDERGSPIPLGWCGLRRQANFIWLCLGTDALLAGSRPRLLDQLLDEVFTDQINIVRLSVNGRTDHLLFSRGHSFKSLH